jgi:hypothetical protein
VSKLRRIVYCSRSLLTGSRANIEMQVRKILAAARRNNKKRNLTGALTFNERCFAQVLEGAPDDLTLIFEKIRCDIRHADLNILVQDEPPHRLFSSWSMAYVDAQTGNGCFPLAHFSFEAALTDGAAPEGGQLLDDLRQIVVRRAKKTDRSGPITPSTGKGREPVVTNAGDR